MKIFYEGTFLSDGNTLIRTWEEADIDKLYEAVKESIPELHAWLSWCAPDYNRVESELWVGTRRAAWSLEEEYSFAVIDASSNALLGGCGINRIDAAHKTGNLGYWLRSSRTRHGIATAAALLTARFGFETLGLHRIEIIAAVGNAASRRVAEKTGSVFEGILRGRIQVENRAHDAALYSLLSQEFKAEPA
jgi:ribosomal-protein-serine acetyltransferase